MILIPDDLINLINLIINQSNQPLGVWLGKLILIPDDEIHVEEKGEEMVTHIC